MFSSAPIANLGQIALPIQTQEPRRTHVGASAIVAIAVVLIMLLGIFVFALRLL